MALPYLLIDIDLLTCPFYRIDTPL